MPKRVNYTNAKDTSKSKWKSTALRLNQNGYTAKEILEKDKNGNYIIDDKQLKSIFQFKGKGYKSQAIGFRKNVSQLQFDTERKRNVWKDVETKYNSMGFRGKKLSRMMVDVNNTLGLNTFFDIARKVQKEYGISKQDSYDKTRDIINQANFLRSGLSRKDADIISAFYYY